MVYIIIGILIFAADFITKFLVSKNMLLYQTIEIIDGVFSLTYIRNKGMAWGMLQNQRWIFIVLTVLIVAVITVYAIKSKRLLALEKIGITLLLSGAIGNLIDRIFYPEGVIDFLQLDFIDFPIFNIADIAVCLGAAAIIIYVIFFERKKER